MLIQLLQRHAFQIIYLLLIIRANANEISHKSDAIRAPCYTVTLFLLGTHPSISKILE